MNQFICIAKPWTLSLALTHLDLAYSAISQLLFFCDLRRRTTPLTWKKPFSLSVKQQRLRLGLFLTASLLQGRGQLMQLLLVIHRFWMRTRQALIFFHAWPLLI